MKFLQTIIFYLFTRLKLTLNSFDDFFYNLQEETEQFLEDLDSYYLKGLLNYSYDGCISEEGTWKTLSKLQNSNFKKILDKQTEIKKE